MPYLPEPLPTYTFKNGAVATVHRVGQMTIAHIAAAAQKKIPPVSVPTFTTDLGNGPTQQPNPADPAYQQAVTARGALVNLATMDTLIELALDIAIDHAVLDQLNATMELVGMPLSEISDKVAYVKHCCITDGSELNTLGALIRGDLEEATTAAAATFSGDLPGPAAVAVQPAELRSPVLVDV